MIAAAVALALVSSNLQAAIQSEEGLRFLGIQLSMPKQGYGSAIIPIIFIIWFMSVIEHFCTKHIHPAARNIVTPLVELVITVPVSFLVFGPIFSALQAAIGSWSSLACTGASFLWVRSIWPCTAATPSTPLPAPPTGHRPVLPWVLPCALRTPT